MSRFRIVFALLSVPLLLSQLGVADDVADTRSVLLISAYDPGCPILHRQYQGVQAVLQQEELEIDVQFISQKTIVESKHEQQTLSVWKQRFAHLPPYDLILTTDDLTAESISRVHKELFSGIPHVFLGVNDRERAQRIAQQRLSTGVYSNLKIDGIISTISRLFPVVERIVAVADATQVGQENLALYHNLRESRSFAENEIFLDVLSLNELTFDELETALSILPENTAVVLLSAFEDRRGEKQTMKQAVQSIVMSSPRPVFSVFDYAMEKGVMGAQSMNHRMQGRKAAKLAVQMLKEGPGKSVPMIEHEPEEIVLNYSRLLQFQVPVSRVPSDARIINKPQNVLFGGRLSISPLLKILSFVLGAMLCGVLVMFYWHKRKMRTRLAVYQTLLDGLPYALAFRDDRGEVQLANHHYYNDELLQADDRSELRLSTESREPVATTMQKTVQYEKRPLNDGRMGWFQISRIPVQDQQTELNGIITLQREATNEHEANEKLAGCNMMYQVAIEANAQILFNWSVKDDFVSFTGAVETMLGYAAEDMPASFEQWVQLAPPEERNRFEMQLQWAANKRNAFALETQLFHADGETRYVAIQGKHVILPGDREKNGVMVGFVTDITLRRNSENVLKEAKERAEMLLRLMPHAVFTMDDNSKITAWNRQAERLTGFTADEVIGQSFSRFCTQHQDKPCSCLDLPERGELTKNTQQVELLTRTGQVRIVIRNSEMIYGKKGSIKGALVTLSDITDRTQLEKDRQNALAFLNTLINAIPCPVFYKDAKGVYLKCNDLFAEQILGLEKGEVIGRTVYDFPKQISKTRADKSHFQDLNIIQGGGMHFYEAPIKCADGRSREFACNKAVIKAEGGEPKGIVGVMIDISAKKRAEDELRKLNANLEEHVRQRTSELSTVMMELEESEERYRSFFTNNHAVMLIVDQEDGMIVDANPAACRYYGYAREQMKSMKIDQVNEAPPEEIEKAIAEAVSEKRKHFVFKHRMCSGEVRDVEVYSGPVFVKGATYIYSVIHDITDRMVAEKALADSEEKYRRLFDEAIDALFLADLHTGIILDCNQAAEALIGRSREDLIGVHQRDLHPDSERGEGRFTTVFEKHRTQLQATALETRVLRCDGTTRDVMIKSSILNYRGRTLIQGIFRDVTVQKQVQDDLLRSEQLFRAVFESTSDCIVVWDENKVQLYANNSFIDYFGMERDQVVRRSIYETLKDMPEFLQLWAGRIDQVFETGKSLRMVDQHKLGQRLAYSDSLLFPVTDRQGHVFATAVVYRNITDRKENERRLSELTESQAVLLQEVNHRVKNNLAALIGILHMEKDKAAQEEESTVCQEVIDNLIIRICGLSTVHNMLSEAHWSPLNISDLATKVINGVLKNIVTDKKDVKVDITPSPLTVESAQAHYLAVVFNEMAMNSVKHAFDEQDDQCLITVKLFENASKIRMEYRDNGIGFPAELSRHESPNGVGIGLIRGIIQQSLQGTVEIYNENGAVILLSFDKSIMTGAGEQELDHDSGTGETGRY